MTDILGTAGDDVIRTAAAGGSLGGLPDATDGGDSIDAGDGNDSVAAGAGDDTIVSGAGADTLDGGGGTNALDFSGAAGGVAMVLAQNELFDDGWGNYERAYGFTVAYGSLHDDPFLAGSATGDSLFGQDGDDAIYGNGGDDSLDGGVGNDRIIGEEGSDLVIGGDGADTLIGARDDNAGFGNDLYAEDGETDTLDGGAGDDSLILGYGDLGTGGEGNDSFGFAAFGNALDQQSLAVGTAVYSGNMADYDIHAIGDELFIEDLVGSDGVDRLGRAVLLAGQGAQVVATLRFADGDLDVLGSGYVTFNQAPDVGSTSLYLDSGSSVGTSVTVSDPEGDPLTFVGIENGPIGGHIEDAAFDPDTGTFSFTYIPDPGFVGEDAFDIVFSDGYQTGRTTIDALVSFDSAVIDVYALGVGRTLLAGGAAPEPGVGANDADINGAAPTGYGLQLPATGGSGFFFDTVDGSFRLTADTSPGVILFVYTASFPDGTSNSAPVLVVVDELSESLDGTSGADTILGYGLDDTIAGGAGDDSIDGGAGHDVVAFGGDIAGYSITQLGYRVIVQDIDPGNGDDGTDTVDGTETLQFSDASYSVTYSYDPLVGVTDARLVNTLGGTSGFGENVLTAGDEQFAGPIDVTSLFGGALDFGGEQITQIYVNTNGNLTFAGPNFTYGQNFGAGTAFGIIGAFWRDLSTAGGAGTPSPGGNSDGANRVFYDLDPTTRTFTATWDDVGAGPFGFPSSHAFQVQLVGRDNGEFDIILRYENNLDGATARAGFANADDSILFELPGSGTGATGSLDTLTGNTGIAGLWQFQIRAGAVAPIALPDAFALDEDQVLTVGAAGVLDNDSGFGALPLFAHLSSGPAHGTLDLHDDGGFTYTPFANYFGADSFSYQATQGLAASQPVTVALTINPVNDAPTSLVLFPAHTPENIVNGVQTGTGVTVGTLAATDPDNAPGELGFTLLDDAGGRFALSGGSIVTAGDLDYETATYHDIQVRVTDPQGAFLDKTLRIAVDNVNEGPTDLVLVGTSAIYENLPPGTLLGTLVGFDGEGDPITYSRVSGPVNVVDDKVYTAISFDYEFQTQFTFTARAADANGDGVDKQFTIFVDNVNESPVAVDDTATVTLGASVEIDVLGNDYDLDDAGGYLDPFTLTAFTQGTKGSVSLGTTGLIYTPDPRASGADTFNYTIEDAAGLQSVAIVTVSLLPVIIIAMPDYVSVQEDSVAVWPLADNDEVHDADGNLIDIPLAVDVIWTSPAHGTLDWVGGNYSYTPYPDYYGPDYFTYASSANGVTSGPTDVFVIVEPVNDDPYQSYVPEFHAVANHTLFGTLASGNGIASIYDPDVYFPSDTLGVGPGTYATNEGGTVAMRADKTFDYTPPADFKGYDTFDFTYNDFSFDLGLGQYVPNGGDHTATVRVLVEGEEPVAVDDRWTMVVGQTVIANVLANDRSPPGLALVEAQQIGGAVPINALGQFTFFAAQSGIYTSAYYAVDAAGKVSLDPAILKITVLPLPPPGTPAGGFSGWSWGDPHLVTYDRLYYDFQGWGEFVMTRATAGDPFEVQIRTKPWFEGAQVTIVESAVAKIGAHTVQLGIDGTLVVDGTATTLAAGGDPLLLSGGVGLWHLTAASYVFAAADGEQVRFDGVGTNSFMNVTPFLDTDRAGAMQGLLGDADGNRSDDLQLADGTVLPQDPITSTLLYGDYAGAWRVTAGNSLFTYAPGGGTADYQHPDFPPTPIRVADLPAGAVAAALTAVQAAGITDPLLQEAAILDLVLTGEAGFLDGAAAAPAPDAALSVVIPPPPPLIGVVSPTAAITEGDAGTAALTFTVFRTGDASDAVDVGWAVQAVGLGFVDAADFGGTLPSGSLTLGVGVLSADITLLVAGDVAPELDETVRVALTSTPSAYVVASATGQGTVLNDDGPLLPQLTDDSATTRAGVAVQILPLANDSDPLGQALSISDLGDAAHGSLALSGAQVTYTPHSGFSGNDAFTYTVTDARGGVATATVTLTVQPNQAPTDIALSSATVAENSAAGTLVGLLSASDPDSGEGFAFSLLDDAGGRFALDGARLVVAGALDFEAAAAHLVSLRVTDAGGLYFDKDILISVGDVPGVLVIGTAASERIDGTHRPAGQPFVSPEDDTVDGGAGNDTLSGLAGGDSLAGGIGNDSLLGGEGNDVLDGGLGADTMRGGPGDDLYRLDDAGDLAFEADGEGADTVIASVDVALRRNVEAGLLDGSAGLTLKGNAAANLLVGNDGANLLSGLGGADSLLGGGGNDTLLGGDGADTLSGGAGRDALRGDAGGDVFLFDAIPASAREADVVLDLTIGEDRIGLLGAAFDATLASGTLDPARFETNTTGQASVAGIGVFVFETDNGRLWWDTDGAGSGRDLVAIFRGGVALGSGDLVVL